MIFALGGLFGDMLMPLAARASVYILVICVYVCGRQYNNAVKTVLPVL